MCRRTHGGPDLPSHCHYEDYNCSQPATTANDVTAATIAAATTATTLKPTLNRSQPTTIETPPPHHAAYNRYLRALHQCVSPGGIVCIVSFHPPKFLTPFFAGGWLVVERVEEIGDIVSQHGHPPVTVLLARRPVDGNSLPPPTSELEELIASSVRSWHTNDDPLLTEDEREREFAFAFAF
jgi:hypothetical protein